MLNIISKMISKTFLPNSFKLRKNPVSINGNTWLANLVKPKI